MITANLVQAILEQYTLPPLGVHGVSHWARVLENGLLLAEKTGADLAVVQLFAIFHDSRRVNESIDPGHGLRGAEFAASLQGDLFEMDGFQFDLLFEACRDHTDGLTEADVTVQTCWDADRLDLGRVGFQISTRYLCTPAARNPAVIAWADDRARSRMVPEFVDQLWLAGN